MHGGRPSPSRRDTNTKEQGAAQAYRPRVVPEYARLIPHTHPFAPNHCNTYTSVFNTHTKNKKQNAHARNTKHGRLLTIDGVVIYECHTHTHTLSLSPSLSLSLSLSLSSGCEGQVRRVGCVALQRGAVARRVALHEAVPICQPVRHTDAPACARTRERERRRHGQRVRQGGSERRRERVCVCVCTGATRRARSH